MSLFTQANEHFDGPEPPSLRAVQALIVHESHRAQDSRRDFAFTTHAIQHTERGVQIGAGRLLSLEDQQALLNILLGSLSGESGYLPPEVLCHSPAQLAWYVPGRMRPMWFRDGTHTRRFKVPWPTLVFRVREGRLALAALSAARRPKAQDRIFHAPLMNVFEDTHLCVGNTKLPKGWTLADRLGYEKTVFDTAFTHVNHEHTLKRPKQAPVTTAEHLRFWRELAREGARGFPARALTPLTERLGPWLGED
jgi:PRTRC genetic system protein B